VALAFLQAEIDSARYGCHYSKILANSGIRRQSLIDQPDRQSVRENTIRKELLTAVRGFGNRTALFQRFPRDVLWRRVSIGVADFGTLKYAKCEPWVALSRGSRRVIDGAENVDAFVGGENIRENTNAVARDFLEGKRYPPLICVDGPGGSLILVEGHTRATAYVLVRADEPIEVLLGSSTQMVEWVFY